ncbi:MAG TPA: glycolate oxidase subunit GlcD [Bacteroidetes bacterium]|nr:MAG: glycolate oxidase subunit GlcD [Ignavibacteria bacterium GWA2_54_16]HCA78117.1 glycolate oxidase subunit GlcD [Bacteroidota bacterium]
MIPQNTLSRIRSIFGTAGYLDSAEDRISYSYDGTPLLKQLPDAIVLPRSVDQISQLLKLANEERFAVVPRGSGSGLSGGSIPVENSVVVLTNHWDRILEIDEKNLSVWVEPGVITAKLHAAVESLGLFYPPDPGSAAICTIGGNVAENAGGLRGLKYGVTKNYVMGMEVVLPNGEVIVTGGKSVKDVAGYSLKDFLIGSEGTLGIITRVLLRLIPKPPATKTMLAFYGKLSDSAETVSEIIAAKITPAALEFLDNTTIRSVEDYAKLGLPTEIESLLLIEVDGRSAEVEEDAQKIISICKRHGASEIRVAADEAEAVKLRTARKAAFSALARVRPTTILEDATVPRSEVAPMLESINRIVRKHGLTFGNFGHAGDGNLHPTCLTDERDTKQIHLAERAFDEIFSEAVRFGGTITGEHGVGLAKLRFLEKAVGEPAIEMMRRIKASIDPNAVLNPGKIFSLRPRCEGPLPTNRDQIKKFVDAGAFT